MNDLLAINRKDDSTVTVQVPKDADIGTVTDALKTSGVIGEPTYFKLYAMVTKNNTFSQGTYELKKNMDYQAIITNLQGTSNRTDTIEVTIIEGQSVLEIADKLEEGGALGNKAEFLQLCNSSKFDNDFDFLKNIKNPGERYYKLEGYLYPDKYEFYVNEDPASIIYKILNNYEKRMAEKQAFDGYEKLTSVNKMLEKSDDGYTLDETLDVLAALPGAPSPAPAPRCTPRPRRTEGCRNAQGRRLGLACRPGRQQRVCPAGGGGIKTEKLDYETTGCICTFPLSPCRLRRNGPGTVLA